LFNSRDGACNTISIAGTGDPHDDHEVAWSGGYRIPYDMDSSFQAFQVVHLANVSIELFIVYLIKQ
jgi:hypothetical protein